MRACACAVLSLIDQLQLRALPPQNPHRFHRRITTGLIALLVLSVPAIRYTSVVVRRKWRGDCDCIAELGSQRHVEKSCGVGQGIEGSIKSLGELMITNEPRGCVS